MMGNKQSTTVSYYVLPENFRAQVDKTICARLQPASHVAYSFDIPLFANPEHTLDDTPYLVLPSTIYNVDIYIPFQIVLDLLGTKVTQRSHTIEKRLYASEQERQSFCGGRLSPYAIRIIFCRHPPNTTIPAYFTLGPYVNHYAPPLRRQTIDSPVARPLPPNPTIESIYPSLSLPNTPMDGHVTYPSNTHTTVLMPAVTL
jgi:hypothetical protein